MLQVLIVTSQFHFCVNILIYIYILFLFLFFCKWIINLVQSCICTLKQGKANGRQ